MKTTKCMKNEKGSLALEQVLFIGAIVLMSAGLFIFYGDLRNYFSTFGAQNFGNLPTVQVPGNGGGNGGNQ